MFEHLTQLKSRNPARTLVGFAASLAVHGGLVALLVYGVGLARQLDDPDPEPAYTGATPPGEAAAGPPGEPAEAGRAGEVEQAGESPADEAGAEAEPMTGNGAPTPDRPEGETPPPAPQEETPRDRAVRLALAGALGAPTAAVPDTLELNRAHRIHLTLPPHSTPADSLLRVPAGPGQPEAEVRLSRVRLAAVHGRTFAVQPELPPLQLADSAAPSRWRWSVVPTRPGDQELHLRLDAVAVVDSAERVVTLWSARAPVVVRATPLQRVSRFFARNWTWLSVLPLIALWIAFRGRRRSRATG